jgi:hypothetical protein
MKKLLTLTLVVLCTGFSTLALADRDRGRYGDGYHYRGDRHVVVNKHYYGRPHHYDRRPAKHWKGHRDYRKSYHYRPRNTYIVERHYHDDDAYKWIGGIYLLNEILHHNH